MSAFSAQDRAIAAYEDVFEKTGVLGNKIDLVLAIVRMGLLYGDKQLVKKHVERAKALVESGGDWDRRNRLKAYEGLYLLTVRSYNLAAPLLLDSLSTFTSYELCTYSNLVVYSVLAGSVSLKRVDLRARSSTPPRSRPSSATARTSSWRCRAPSPRGRAPPTLPPPTAERRQRRANGRGQEGADGGCQPDDTGVGRRAARGGDVG